MSPPVILSSSSLFPQPTAATFELAARLGYDGVEVMVWTDMVSQDAAALRGLARHYRTRVRSVHAPCLLVTQRVWSPDPSVRLRRAVELAEALEAPTVVVHPPFTWQRKYAREFSGLLTRLREEFPGVTVAVENMFPVRLAGRELVPYTPSWDATRGGYPAYTLDISHCAASCSDPMAMADAMGAKLAHVHLGDGRTPGRDEHLVPGRGEQPCGPLLASLSGRGFTGTVAVEVSTRRASGQVAREADLAETLAFARRQLSAPTPAT